MGIEGDGEEGPSSSFMVSMAAASKSESSVSNRNGFARSNLALSGAVVKASFSALKAWLASRL